MHADIQRISDFKKPDVCQAVASTRLVQSVLLMNRYQKYDSSIGQ